MMRAAAIQLNCTGENAANIAAADRHVRAAAADGAGLVVLPEKWTVMGGADTLRRGAEPLDGPAVGWARSIAAELGIELVAGSITERRQGTDMLANTCLHVDRTGAVQAIYRKIHMFDVEVEGRVYRESEIEEPGDRIVMSELPGDDGQAVPLGLAICYDLRFPELFRILAVRGALLIAMPSAFTLPTTRAHWEILLRARAIENQVFMIASNQVGEHADGHRSGGRSMIVDPWGTVLADAGQGDGHVIADLDLAAQSEIRRRLPSLANRRESAYRWPAPESLAGARSGSQAGGPSGAAA